MQDYSLTVDKFLDHAARWFADREIIGIGDAGDAVTRRYADLRGRANRLSGALLSVGMTAGDRIATLAWNSLEHVELYYGTMGVGLICHTLNPRLSEEHLVAMVNQAADRMIAVSADLLPLAKLLCGRCASLERILVLPSAPAGPIAAEGANVDEYEVFLAEHGAPADWGAFDERTGAGLCYTSGTTSDPKGVLYTHRSNYLHTLRALQADALAIDARDTLLLAVPMFHANGWGIPFAAPAVGSGLVLPGRHLDGESLARAIVDHDVTVAVGVQTVWLGLADHVERTGANLPSLQRILIGGSSCPPALIDRLGRVLAVEVQTSWGMTELSPIGTIAPPGMPSGGGMASGRPVMGLDLRVTGADGVPLQQQRDQVGHLQVRGASVVDTYYGGTESALDGDGYFDTGDLAIIHANGTITIAGRSKDLIKSGGEWINPTEIEQVAGSHPGVRHVAVIGRDDERWGERPILIVEAEHSSEIAAQEIIGLLRARFANWWVPSAIEFVDAMPLAATGKVDKQALRARYSKTATDTNV